MPLGGGRTYDAYGHPTDPVALQNSGYAVATTGTAPSTIVNPGTNDPTGTTNIANPFMVSDSYGQFQITPKGTQSTTGILRTIYFTSPYPMVRPALVAITTNTGTPAAAGGTLVVTMEPNLLSIKVGTKLTSSGAVYNVAYTIL